MTKSQKSYKDFLSLVRKEGLSKTTKFEVLIIPPSSNELGFMSSGDVSLLAESAVLPKLDIRTERLKIYGPSEPRPIDIDYGETMSISFYLDNKMNLRDFFERWINLVVNKSSFNVNYQREYVSNEITITKLDNKDDVVRTYTFKEAFPISIQASNLSYSSVDQFDKIEVTFAYRTWEAKDTKYSTNWISSFLG